MSETLFKIDRIATRYHFEPVGNGDLKVSVAWKGKTTGFDAYDYLPGTRMEDCLDILKAQGWSCKIHRDGHGEALKTRTTRIDFLKTDKGWTISKYPDGWTAATPPTSTREATPDEIANAIEWCKSHNWNVREFPNGARAWLGEVMPIRDRYTLRRMYEQVRQNVRAGIPDERSRFDLKYDC